MPVFNILLTDSLPFLTVCKWSTRPESIILQLIREVKAVNTLIIIFSILGILMSIYLWYTVLCPEKF